MGWIKRARESAEMTQEAVAKAAEVSRGCYSNIENGRRRPSPEGAQRIAKVLGFDWTLFFVDSEPDEKAG